MNSVMREKNYNEREQERFDNNYFLKDKGHQQKEEPNNILQNVR